MKLDFFELHGRQYYQANVWVKLSAGDPLLLEEFSTKREAVKCVKDFVKQYKGVEELDCYVGHYDEHGLCDYAFGVC